MASSNACTHQLGCYSWGKCGRHPWEQGCRVEWEQKDIDQMVTVWDTVSLLQAMAEAQCDGGHVSFVEYDKCDSCNWLNDQETL